jgi:hypothetical protein
MADEAYVLMFRNEQRKNKKKKAQPMHDACMPYRVRKEVKYKREKLAS